MPIFPNPDGDQTTWYLGNIFMKNYYVAFDMTPYTDNNYRYLQVGIGLQKAQEYEPEYKFIVPTDYNPDGTMKDPVDSKKSGGGGGFFVFLLLCGGGVAAYYYWKKKQQNETQAQLDANRDFSFLHDKDDKQSQGARQLSVDSEEIDKDGVN